MMNKGKLPHIITVTAFVVFIVLGLACATGPMLSVELGANYRGFLLPPVGNERRIDTIGVRGNSSFVCRDGSHAVTPAQALGATYQVPEKQGIEKHKHEVVFDKLQNEAKRHYPSESIDIRSAKTARHDPTNPRQEQYQDSVRNSDGTYSTVTRTRTVWDCYPYYTADVITTEPMPAPVTHSENFTKPGSTRNDINRLALNWLEDNKSSRRIVIESQDFDRGRIKGTVRCAARADQTYIITSAFTIDVYDARVELRFDEPVLQRTDAEMQYVGSPEKIFLQSIADSALEELVDFSTTLRSYIISR